MTMVTTTLFKIIQSELIKKGFNEFIDSNGNLVIFDNDHQFMKKIFTYDDDITEIVENLFSGLSLEKQEYDEHFKKNFLYRFINRQINRQTVESFRLEMLSTFMSNEDFINRVYADLDQYLTQKQTTDNQNKQTNEQTNKQKNDGSTVTDNRSAFADLPQTSVNLNVDSTNLEYATDNTIARNKQTNLQETDGTTTGENKGESTGENNSYQLDELFKTNGLLESIYNKFDEKCFLQVW